MTDPEILRALGEIRAELEAIRAEIRAPERRLVTREEAAETLGMSLRHFQRHAQPELRLVRSGGKRLVPVAELDRWISENVDR